jgi:hypothetical protein
MIDRAHQIALALLGQEKAAGAVTKALKEGAKGYFDVGRRMAETAAEHGMKSPLALAGLKYAPHAGALYAGKKTWESRPVQRARYKLREMQARRQMRRMRG